MRYFLIVVAFLFSSLVNAGIVPSNASVPSLTLGNRVFTDIGNLKTLYCAVINGTNSQCTGRLSNASAGYQVTAGKTFYVIGIEAVITTAAAGTFYIHQQDNDTGSGSTTSPTNAVYIAGSSNNYLMSTAVVGKYSIDFDFPVAAAKYVGMDNGGSNVNATIKIYGYER